MRAWDPEQYLRYGEERARPFTDLLARVKARRPAYVVDLGCGPGDLTASLRGRWPDAEVVGVDSSPQMIEHARRHAAPGLSYVEADLREWRPARPVDVLVSSSTLQWVPGHLELLERLVRELAPGGELAVQVPANFTEPTHRILHEMQDDPRWRDELQGTPRPASHDAARYLEVLLSLGCAVDAWETTYLHVLRGDDAVLEWMTGTGARPTLQRLDDDARAEFLETYRGRLRRAYPAAADRVVLPYRRVFFVARRPPGE